MQSVATYDVDIQLYPDEIGNVANEVSIPAELITKTKKINNEVKVTYKGLTGKFYKCTLAGLEGLDAKFWITNSSKDTRPIDNISTVDFSNDIDASLEVTFEHKQKQIDLTLECKVESKHSQVYRKIINSEPEPQPLNMIKAFMKHFGIKIEPNKPKSFDKYIALHNIRSRDLLTRDLQQYLPNTIIFDTTTIQKSTSDYVVIKYTGITEKYTNFKFSGLENCEHHVFFKTTTLTTDLMCLKKYTIEVLIKYNTEEPINVTLQAYSKKIHFTEEDKLDKGIIQTDWSYTEEQKTQLWELFPPHTG